MALQDINNLGKYADMSAVWYSHPEGGREGDFLTIGQTKFRWNIFKRRWEAADSTSPGGTTDETVDGDLTVGGNLHVGGDADFQGDVTINGELRLPNGDRYKGQSSYKSIVFTRSDEQPDAPTGGSYANPLPDGNVWKDGIPAGTKPVWMSSRVFTSDGNAPATSSWAVPALMSDSEDFDVEFSPAPTDTVPPAPVSGVNGNLGWLWFDPVRNPNANWNAMNWMATRSKSQGTWSDWTIILIKGEAGDGVQSVFTVTNGSIPSISGSAYPPSGWYKSVDNLTVGQGDVLWMSDRRFENGAWSAWSAPVRLNGVDGLPGEDGTDIEFIYKRMNRLPNTGGNVDSAPESINVDDYIPSTWFDHPSGVDATHLFEWACQRTKSGDSDTWGPWIGPFVWSAFGERGMDGDGVEYVFIRTTVFTAPTITETAVQEAEHCPEVANYSSYNTGEIDGNTFFDNPKGVGPTWLYEWVSRRKKVGGEWGTFSAPALWATYSEEHTIDIDPVTGCWIIDGHVTDKKAIGQGVAVKGSVDYYSTSSQGYVSGASTLEDITSPSIGDSYVVNADGHLYLCVATSGTLATMWYDLGEFKGEPGQSQYMHIAWASKINFTGSPQQFASAEGFTKDYVAGRSYDWMGVTVDSTESDANLEAVNYKWNYLKGKDGNDVEFVYLRTRVNTAPTITEAAVQTPERYPAVANYNSYDAGDAEHDTFTDDPNGVDSTWKYEWVSRREKIYNANTGKMEWGQFLTPARLWSKWGEPGQPGESVTQIKTSVPMLVIDTDAEGNIPSEKRSVSIRCFLYYGENKIPATTYSATYGGSPVSATATAIGELAPYITVSFQLPAKVTETKDIVVNMANSLHSASATIPVIINKAGAEGRDVYKSIVFMRSASKPTKPGSNDGDYYSPVPSGTYNDGGVTRQWSDGVDAGTLPVWMTSRIFYSDGQPSGDSWADVVLMQDTDVYDVEFTDADLESSPGTPDNPATGVTWYDPVDDAAEFANRHMNWMAQRVKVVTANGTSWGNWVVNRIRGEKGNDGAGQAYIETTMDQIIVDCGPDGKPKSSATHSFQFTAKLKWGDEVCKEISVQSGTSVTTNRGSMSTSFNNAANEDDDTCTINISFSTSTALTSGHITITLCGRDSNDEERIATKTVSIQANVQGATGNTGPALRFRGEWNDREYYTYNDVVRDCVKYNGVYYILITLTNGQQTNDPINDQMWISMGNMQFVATDLLLAEQGTIQNLVADYIRTAVTGPRVEMYGNVAKFFGNGAKANIEMMVDADGVACLRFYDKNGDMLYDLGPRGINWLRTTVIEARFAQTYTQYVKMNGNQPDKSTSTTGQAYLYQFNAQRSNGVIEADDNYASTAAAAAAADGKYFIYNNVRIENNQLANGLYRPSSAPIFTYSSVEKAGDVPGMQAELMATYGLSQSQINAFDWTTGGAADTLVKAIKMQDYVSFESGVFTNKIAIWQENNNNASFLVNAV